MTMTAGAEEEEGEGSAVVASTASRSHSWRVSLGLLEREERRRQEFRRDREPASQSDEDGDGGANNSSCRRRSNDATAVNARKEAYDRLALAHPFPPSFHDGEPSDEEEDNEEEGGGTNVATPAATTAAADELDPLTAMMLQEQAQNDRMQELDLRYRKERARRKRIGTSSSSSAAATGGGGGEAGGGHEKDGSCDESAVTLRVIENDLRRLPDPFASSSSSAAGGRDGGDCGGRSGAGASSGERKRVLRRVLYLYHCEHGELGYRQGMHEIASWLLYSMELDGVDADLLGSECYSMLERILGGIAPAYDCAPGHEKPLDGMSRRILALVERCDAGLCRWLEEATRDVPAAIYLTKWIRLMFSREVDDVLSLWDAFFAHVAEGYTWMAVLEATGVSRLVMYQQPQLLQVLEVRLTSFDPRPPF